MLVNLHTVEVRSWVERPENVYIGRPSKWGNQHKISKVLSREKVVQLYEEDIKNNPVLLRDLHQLRGKNLGCWCYPQPCHGNIIQKLLQQQQQQQINMSATDFKILIVTNIGPTVTSNDLSKLFQFHSTPFLRKNTCVEIKKDDGQGMYAKVVVPSSHYNDVLNMNDVEFYGSNLCIKGADDDVEEDSSARTSSETTESPILHMMLDCRNFPALNFPPVATYEVYDALNIEHGDDPLKVVKAGWGRTLGTFEIQSDDISSYINTVLTIRGNRIPLTPVRKTTVQNARQSTKDFDPNSIKIRIFDAFNGPYREMDNSCFNEFFSQLGVEIVIPTQIEREKNRRDFNSNRYIVVKKVDADGKQIDFGERITVDDKTFKISYYGQLKFCGACKMKHGWDCPTKARNNFLRTLRQGKTDEVKIYSDSNLRLTNQLALSSDVACMSGGGIGQLINVIPYDTPHKKVIISGGTNDLKVDSLKEYVYSVKNIESKLKTLASVTPVTIALPPLQTNVPDLLVRGKFLKERVSQIENVDVVQLANIEVDETHHPTEKGTTDMLKQIDASANIIMDDCEPDLISKQRYRGVQKLFKTGCRGCDDLSYTHVLCAKCKEDAVLTDTTVLEDKIKELMDEMYPAMDVDGNKDNSGIKRVNSDEDENAANQKKQALDGAALS